MFEITIEKQALSKILSYIEPTVGKNSQFNSDCIQMSADSNAIVTFCTNNTTEFTSVTMVCGGAQGCDGDAPLVPFKKFKSIIDTIDNNDIITLKNLGGALGIIYSSSISKKPIELAAVTGTTLPLPTIQNAQSQMSIEMTEFNKMISFASDITDPNASMPIYSCMRIEQENGKTDCSCIDYTSKRLFSYNFKNTYTGPDKTDVLIEVHKFAKSIKMFEYCTEADVEMDATNVHISSSQFPGAQNGFMQNISSVDYFCRRITGSYPSNITSSLTPGCDEYAKIDINALLSVMMRVKAIDDKTPGSSVINFNINKDTMYIQHATSLGKVDEEIIINNILSNLFNASFNYVDLSDIIESIKKTDVSAIEIGKLKTNANYYMVSPECVNGQDRQVMFAISSVAQQASV